MKQQKKLVLLGYRNKSIKLYKPKANKLKVGGLLALVVFCLITPCTNWIIPVTMKAINKFNPLWVYK